MKTPSWFQYPTYKSSRKHAIIIGGGIAGAQTAWHLCQKNWDVTLIERHSSLATEASGNPAGVISPKMTAQVSDGEDFYTQSFNYTLSQLHTLENENKNTEWNVCGVLQLAHNQRELRRWQALKDRNLSTDLIQLLDEAETQETAGISLHPKRKYKSSYFPNGAWVNPASFVETLCDHSQCEIIRNSEAIRLEKSSKEWRVLDHQNKLISKAEVIVITNGKDILDFEQSSFLPYMPVAGQTTLAKASALSNKLKTVIGHEGYLTPATVNHNTREIQHTFGATFDRNVNQPSLTTKADTQNFNQLSQYLPNFANSLENIESAHVAVRISTPDRFPYVGGLPDKNFYQEKYHDLHQGKKWKKYPNAKYQDSLFVLGGLGSRGLTTSGYCAKVLVELLENKLDSNNSRRLLVNCHPARFLIKNLKRNIRD